MELYPSNLSRVGLLVSMIMACFRLGDGVRKDQKGGQNMWMSRLMGTEPLMC